MAWIRKLWNYQQSEEMRKTLKARALRGFVWLLLFMLACTLLSRAADSLTLAVVVTETPRQGSVTEITSFSGVLQADGDIPVTGYPGTIVQSVLVSPGDTVKTGDPLFRLDLAPLQRQIAEREQNIALKEAELKALQSNKRQASNDKRKSKERIQEDMDQAMIDADRAIAEATENWEMAKKNLQDYHRYTDVAQFSKIQSNALENEIRMKERAIAQAQLDKEDTLREYQRMLEDADSAAQSSSDLSLLTLGIEQLEGEIEALQEAIDTQSEVCAPMDGIVTAVNISVGQLTGQEALLLLNDGQNIRFVGEITEKQAEDVEIGTSISLKLTGQEKLLNLTVSSMELSTERADRYVISAALPSGEGRPGLHGEANIEKRFVNQQQCITLSALHQDGEQEYVLQVIEKKSVLGTEFVVQRVNVEVVARNESMAAITASFGDQPQLVMTASKPVQDGDRVRLGG